MSRFRTVVVAIDFSADSKAALICGADLAERSGATLHLLHADVLFRSSGDGVPPDAVPSSTLRVRIERFAAAALGLDDAADLSVFQPDVAVVRDVSAPGALLRYADDVDADVLVVGTHGRSGVARMLLGSVAEACVASATCPVLTVPRDGQHVPSPTEPVLVAVDFSERSRSALRAGQEFAALFGADVELVHVVRDSGPYPGFAPNILSLTDYDPAEGARVKERLERFASTVPGTPPAAFHIGLGAPSRVVPKIARERNAGALVLGTHGRTGLSRIIGSVAEASLRRSPCPVLTLKEAERLGRRTVQSALA